MDLLGCWFIPNSLETSMQQLLLAQEESFLMGISRTQGFIVQDSSGGVTNLNTNYICFQSMSNISMVQAEHRA